MGRAANRLVRRLLRIPNARIYLAGETLSILGDTAMWLAMAVWVKTLTASSSAAGLVFFAFALPQLAAPLSGLLVDRIRRRPLLIATNLLMGAAVLLLLLVHSSRDVWLIYLVAALYGAAYTVLSSGQVALLPAMLPDDALPDANGALQTIRQGLRLISPLLGAGLFVVLGGGTIAALDTATFLVAAASLVAVRVHEDAPTPSRSRWWAEAMGGLRHVQATVVLRQLVIAAAPTMLLVGFTETIVFAIVDQGLHQPPAFVGVLLAAQGIGGIAGGLLAGPSMRRVQPGVVFGFGLAAFAVSAVLLAVPSLPVVLGAVVLFGIGLPLLIASLTTLLQRTTPPGLRGRVSSAFDLLVGTPQTLSIALGAALVAAVDYRLLLVACAVVTGVCAAYVLTRREQVARVVDVVTGSRDRVC